MDYGRRDLADRLASEYVLGTLRGPARRRFEALLGGHPQLRDAVARWQVALTPLSESVAPVPPSPQVWTGIESRLFPAAAAEPWWRRLGPWRALSGLGGLSAAALVAVLLIGQPPAPPGPTAAPIVVLLGANPQVATAAPARFVASLSADGRALVLRPIDAPALGAQQALELWSVPRQGAPRSLGLVKADGPTVLLGARALGEAAALAVSIEPAGGSPTGAPTGPIVSLGQLDT